MTAAKVAVPYDHQERDLQTIWLAVTRQPLPAASEWRPAYRDTVNGQRVVWARFPDPDGAVWLRDRDGGDRQIKAGTATRVTAPQPQTGPRRVTGAATATVRDVNPNTRWDAQVTSNRIPRHDSVEPLSVRVVGPVALSGLRPQVGVESQDAGNAQSWRDATWLEVSGGEGVAAANLGEGELRLRPGRYHALVRLVGGDALPVVFAGNLNVK